MTGAKHEDSSPCQKQAIGGNKGLGWVSVLPIEVSGWALPQPSCLCPQPLKAAEGKDLSTCLPSAWLLPVPTPSASH